jgi:hypothetical protein
MGIIKRTSGEEAKLLLGQTFTPVLLPLNQLSSNLADGCVGVDANPPTLGRTVFPPLKLVELPLKLPSINLGNMVEAWWWKNDGAGEDEEGFKDIFIILYNIFYLIFYFLILNILFFNIKYFYTVIYFKHRFYYNSISHYL